MTDRPPFHSSDIPAKPGVYVFRDRFDEVIYVGKARDLRRRVSQYFHPSRVTKADPKTRSLINSIAKWECYPVRTEAEALLLESRYIKQYAPRYNILLRDDKRFYMIKIHLNERFPRLSLARVRKDDGCRYYGPFPQTGALPQTVEFLRRRFQLRLCKLADPDAETRKHCMDVRVKLCCGPCVGTISEADYTKRVEALVAVLEGDVRALVEQLEEEMRAAAAALDFEKAAARRDMAQNLSQIFGARNRNFRFASIPSAAGTAATEDLQQALGMKRRPDAIEAFDISTLGGQASVASLVRFVDGKPDRAGYRRFRIKHVEGVDDFAMMDEVLRRHFKRKLEEGSKMPDLVLVDGGKGQLNAALKALVDLGVPALPLMGLAKRQEEIFLPGRSEPLVLDEHRPALRLLRAVRDEAHRFAVSFNRELRDRKIKESVLDDIPGVGPERKKALLIAFGSVAKLRHASAADIRAKVPGLGEHTAAAIVKWLEVLR